ncbi:MAG: SRPBCC family protein [Caulobacteraceae bacterium]
MTLAAEPTDTLAERELVLTRVIDASPEKLFRCWTEPALIKQWFAPAPLTTPLAELDVRVGGENLVVMKLPDGTEMPNRGVYLEVVANKKLVWTDAYAGDWRPKDGSPFMTAILTFDDLGNGKTRYTARVRHWSVADRERHEAMGFHTGWGQCADQLAALAARI